EELKRLGHGGEGGLLSVWLDKVGRDHRNLVPFYEHADLELLDRVYVQLELRPEERLLRGGEEMALGLGQRQLAITDLLALERAEHAWLTQRWVVRGDPGAGKSTLLRHLAAKLAGDPKRRWVPVVESLPRLMRKPEWLLDRIEREMRKTGEAVQGMAAALDREGQEGRLLLLLDGLDEVPREEREDAEALLRQLSARWPKTPLVVTSRPIGYRRPGSEFVELELLPFDDAQRQEFLARWFGRRSGTSDEDRATGVMAVLRSDAGLWDLSGNPLYLTLMALLFEEDKEPERNRATLYDQVFELLLEGRHRPAGQPIDAKKAVYQVLRQLAFDMTADNRDAEPKSEIEARLLKEEYDPLCAPLRRVPSWQRSLGPFLDDLSEKVGILGPHDGPAADWRYWHRTFREALAAEQLAEDLRSGGEASILERARSVAGDESRWAEPFALLVGRVEDPDTLVTSLVETNRALGLRAVATAQRLGDDTLRAVLNLTDEWEKRSEVYREIPALLDDPERALALVDRLRQRTSDGNDLFFLDETVTAVGKRWPEAARLVTELHERFFDHLQAPQEDLFGRIETRDGQVELWREIPAGESWIGAAEGEEDHDDERPRHRVAITQPFRMAAVPVTNAQYAAFDPTHRWYEWPGVSREELARYPLVEVTWYAATAFCRWLSTHFLGARLPIEEEWEVACRAGTETRYWSGDEEKDLKRVAWYAENSEGGTHRVGEKPANAWGLYDVHGNVWEWTASPWDEERYKGREGKVHLLDPATPADVAGGPRVGRVVRGGSCRFTARWCRSACRDSRGPGLEFWDQGFRVLLSFAPSRPSI
ncbi:MAG: SUMF1/EgtB/PvdO family nonheme iron enzyme, partial [Thermoanaerobaculia bacterium]